MRAVRFLGVGGTSSLSACVSHKCLTPSTKFGRTANTQKSQGAHSHNTAPTLPCYIATLRE
ncbi:MAG: hypothetical protein FWC71_01830 [Defluviitaleaceae bacterium]|nr:hypothetical protein [Defluviitaleaceae bacterium]